LHAHDYYQLIYCQHGKGEITIGERRFSVTPGKAYFIPPMIMHSINPDEGMRIAEVKFEVSSDELSKAIEMLPEEIDIDEHVSLRLSMKEMLREGLSNALFSHESTNAALSLLLIRLLREHNVKAEDMGLQSYFFNRAPGREAEPSGSSDTDFLKVLDYIERHLSEEITLDDLARIVHFEKTYLITKFKEIWGLSPMKYVNTMRIERAKTLLRRSEKSITEIAYETGFGSIHYFSRYFKESVGITPNEYRTKNK
jgi:YesN/AraC family two-component response regulator